jgi:23S rRNA pseudouridine2605 synthase
MNGNTDQNKSGERIAKVIARAGLASRREAEAWIEAGRVAVNGETIRSPALDVTPRDRIAVDGEPLPERERTRLFLYHKPRGLMTTHADPQGRPTIFANLPPDLPRLISVGRLDFNTEGLLLLTNDGELARVLELPATGWLRRYRVRAHGAVTQDKLDELRKGVTISGIHYGAIEAAIDRVQGSNLWLSFAIREGKNREVRTVLTHLGLTVTRLIRVSFGPFQLGELAEGAVEEVRTRVLREQLGDKLATMAATDFSGPRTAPAPSRKTDEPRDAAAQAKAPREKLKKRQTSDHAWRAHEDDRRTKKLRRKFHGARREDETHERPAGKPRAGLLKDRKGRRVAVERYGEPVIQEWHKERPQENQEKRHGRKHERKYDRTPGAKRQGHPVGKHEGHPGGKRGRPDERPNRETRGPSRGRRFPDRASGPRPRHPRGR